MKGIDGTVQKDGNNVIIKSDQVGVIDRQSVQSINDESNPMLNKTENVGNASNNLALRSRRFVDASIDEQNLRSIDVIQDLNEHMNPIVGYANEPLLPLAEACASLVNIVHNLSAYIQLALNETPLKPSDDLTFDESAAIRLYSMEWDESHESLYVVINIALKNTDHQTLRPYFKYLKLLLTALIKLPCVPVQTVWRGVPKDLSKEFPPRTQVIWWTLSSCITSLVLLENNMHLSNKDERTLFSIDIINGRNIRAHSHFDMEDEILLLPGTCMEVQSQFNPARGINIIHLRQMIPMERLLEPPFKGALLYSSTKKKVRWYKNKWIICALILLIIFCLAGIIVGAVGNPLGYNGYGCWCGAGSRGRLVVDETDRCCQVHDLCWELASRRSANCKPFWRWYDYDKNYGEVQCTDPVSTCDRDTCLCDKAAVECFARHRPTTYDSDIDNWKGICDKTSNAPEDDPDRCPPVWNPKVNYPGGSYVSVHGIVYRAFYYADRGRSPERYSSTWQGSGSTWQKLGPCRESYVDDDPEGAIKEAFGILDELTESQEVDLLGQLEELFPTKLTEDDKRK